MWNGWTNQVPQKWKEDVPLKWLDGKVQKKIWNCHWYRSNVVTISSACKKNLFSCISIFLALCLSIHFIDTSSSHFCDTWSVHSFHINQNSLKKFRIKYQYSHFKSAFQINFWLQEEVKLKIRQTHVFA